ncbi:MAG: ATP-binding protein [Firmicutes bacterium]|nr:ATP-binding protein [Bacillota bacterium]
MSGVESKKTLKETALWKQLKKADDAFVTAVDAVCSYGINLSKSIIRVFPQFTLHDETHIVNVCEWMAKLLGDKLECLNQRELAILLMSACCHDIGMSVSASQKKALEEQFREEAGKTGLTEDELGRRMREYVRKHHHERVELMLDDLQWPLAFFSRGGYITKTYLIDLCRSHGENLTKIDDSDRNFDLALCAVLLRLADFLDFDPSRAPESLFKHMGLAQPEDAEQEYSTKQWQINQAGVLEDPDGGFIVYRAEFDDANLYQQVSVYLDDVEEEIKKSDEYLYQHAFREELKGFSLPRQIIRKVKTNGFDAGSFQLNMDQDGVLTLLSGESLYEDAGVFVRELLQNSIDAVLHRVKAENGFSKEDGKIHIHTWRDADGYDWFRITDNGMGMSKDKIQKYFLKVGKSFYESKEYKDSVGEAGASAISRFGIGVLSCFMAAPENNQLELSTLEKGSPAVRLSVPSLHGYYKLTENKTGSKVKPADIPHPPGERAEAYRSEPGTSICVRTSLYRLGNYRSFREIIDKYLCFPEVEVLHVDETEDEKEKKYPTQQQLMDAVHALNDEKEKKIIEYVHPIPDAVLEEWKKESPNKSWKWKKKPAIVFKYIPLDWYSDSENLTGACIGVTPNLCDFFSIRVSKRGLVVSFFGGHPKFSKTFVLPWISLSEEEAFLFKMGREEGEVSFFSYNGVLADITKFSEASNMVNLFCLFREEYRPKVDLGRNEVNKLPLEAVCTLYIFGEILGEGLFGYMFFPLDRLEYPLSTEKEIIYLLEKHPSWEIILTFLI